MAVLACISTFSQMTQKHSLGEGTAFDPLVMRPKIQNHRRRGKPVNVFLLNDDTRGNYEAMGRAALQQQRNRTESRKCFSVLA